MPSWTVDCQASLSMGILQARILEWVAMPSSKGSSQPGNEPRSPALQEDSLLTEEAHAGFPLGKPINTGVSSLSLLQEIFLTQESNWGLLYCRWILYQLSYQYCHRFRVKTAGCVTLFWLVGGEITGRCSRNLVLSLKLPSSTWVGSLVPLLRVSDSPWTQGL